MLNRSKVGLLRQSNTMLNLMTASNNKRKNNTNSASETNLSNVTRKLTIYEKSTKDRIGNDIQVAL